MEELKTLNPFIYKKAHTHTQKARKKQQSENKAKEGEREVKRGIVCVYVYVYVRNAQYKHTNNHFIQTITKRCCFCSDPVCKSLYARVY